MTNNVPISVIIPFYNATDTLLKSVKSVWNQTQRPNEIILIDDASTEHESTQKLLDKIKRETPSSIRLKQIKSEINRGPGECRNLGWDSATEPHIAFLDADDKWDTRKLEIQFNWIKNNQETILLGAKCRTKEGNSPASIKVRINSLLWKNPFCTSTVILKTDIKYRFESSYFSEDYLLWAQIVSSEKECYLMKSKLSQEIKKAKKQRLTGKYWSMFKGEFKALKFISGKLFPGLILLLVPWSFIKFSKRIALNILGFEN